MCTHLTCYFFISSFLFFFFNDTPTTEIYTLSLHDALPISPARRRRGGRRLRSVSPSLLALQELATPAPEDRKSTRLNSSHRCISYAVFCLKKKKNKVKSSITMV